MKLTPRERQIFTLILEGLTIRAIAGQLVVSPKTVESHCDNIRVKFGVPTLRAACGLLAKRELARIY